MSEVRWQDLVFDRQSNVSEQLYLALKKMIEEKTLSAGYKFPSEPTLCAFLDVSRSSLREAYTKLSALHYIKRSKAGTRVCDIKDSCGQIPFDHLLAQSDIRDLMDLRIILEEEIAFRAALNTNEKGVKKLQGYIDLMKDNLDNLQLLCVYDASFHYTLAQMSGNRLWQSIFRVVQKHFEAIIYLAFEKDNTIMYRAIFYHEKILNAVRSGNPDLARQIMREHVDNVNQIYLEEESK